MNYRPMHLRTRLAAAAVLSLLPLTLAACGGSGSSNNSSGGDASTLRVLDYYNNEPDKTVYT